MKYTDIVGSPLPLSDSIPTNRDVVKYVIHRKEQEGTQIQSTSQIINVVAGEIINFYENKPYVSSVIAKSSIAR